VNAGTAASAPDQALPDLPQNPLLEQLRDIHAAADPHWWPPAPGWWLLGALLLLALFFAARLLARRLAVRRRRRRWLAALDQLAREWDPASQPREFLAALNRLFRAVALRAFPASACARLEGEEWVGFIRANLQGQPEAPCLAALARGPYEPAPRFDAAALQAQARVWVMTHG
jgi:hypothetical protein